MNGRLPRQPMGRRAVLSAGAVALAGTGLGACDALSVDPATEGGSDGDGRTGKKSAPDQKEAPALDQQILSGSLPSLAHRLPKNPLVLQPTRELGEYGGTWHNVIGGSSETTFILDKIGYDYLVTWSLDWSEVLPNVAEKIETTNGGREHVVTLREGMKWSDGKPFSSRDLLFVYEDVFSDKELFPAGAPLIYRDRSGTPAKVEAAGDHVVRFIFAEPNPLFLQELATSGGDLTGYPFHYLRQFHAKYAQDAATKTKDAGYDTWAKLFADGADPTSNPDLPTLWPWTLKTRVGPSNRITADRNPYYWKTDPKGRQLPYMDRVTFDVVSDPEVILLKTMNGEYDLQFQYGTKPKNKPVFARNRSRGHYGFVEMTNTSMNDMVIALNLTHKDEAIREIFGQKLFRTGLSRAINRDKIIEAVYQRQGEPYQSAPRPESDYYDDEFARQYTDYDPAAARKDLDAVLPEKDSDGWRVRQDGKRLSIAVEVVSDRPWWVDSLELVKGFWKAVGVDMTIKAEDRSLWAERSAANDHDALVWTGDAGLRDGLLYPAWYFPYNGGSRFAVPWAEWYESGGKSGTRPPEAPLRQMHLYDEFRRTIDADKRKKLFTEILAIAKEQFYTIGTVLPKKKYGIVKNDLHNVPGSFYYGWVYHFCGPTRCEQYCKPS